MDIKELLDFIFQYGVGIVCLVYLMYFQLTTMKDLTKNQEELNATLREVNTNLSNINLRLDDIEEKVNKKEKGD